MTLASAWAQTVSAFSPSQLLQSAKAHSLLASLFEPQHPSRCAYYDSHLQKPLALPEAQEAFRCLVQHQESVPATSKEARTWHQIVAHNLACRYVARCQAAFAPVCSEILAPLRDSPSSEASTAVPQAFEDLARWMEAWASPLLVNGLFESLTAARSFQLQFHTQLRLQIDAQVLEAVRTFLARTIPLQDGQAAQDDINRLASSAEALGLSAVILTLLTSVLHSEISRKVTASTTGQGATEDDEVWELEEPAREKLIDWLDNKVKPRFQAIVQLCAHKARPSIDAMDVVVDDADRLIEDEFSDEGTWESRLDYHLDRTLCAVRALQLFDLIAIYPESVPALEDLRVGLERTDDKLFVARALSESLQTRLLHPGAHTRDIIQIYVHMVRALRDVDPSGVVLSRVVAPLRRYLRARKDTIPVIVSSLLGEDPDFTLLKDELEAADAESADEAENSAARGGRRRRRSMANRSRKRQAAGPSGPDPNASASASSDSDSDLDYQDPEWQPKPVDAGRGYRLSTSRDIIGMLISIFDDRAGFIGALEQSMAEQLVRIRGYKAMREYRNNMILKKRFGEKNMGRCDVMLGDVTESRRIDAGVHQRAERERRNYAAQTAEERERQRDSNEVLDALHPLVISRQFWPDLSTASSAASGSRRASTPSVATAAGATGTAASAVTVAAAPTKLPPRFAEAMQRYQTLFQASKAMRRLEWLLHLGSVQLELAMDDGRKLQVECSPLEACVVETLASTPADAAGQKRADPYQLAQMVGLEDAGDAVNACRAWCERGVLGEMEDGSFVVLEHLEQGEKAGDEAGDGREVE
ncbi:hypothetical protein ACQY0O_008354 [Thecaphora frezii]